MPIINSYATNGYSGETGDLSVTMLGKMKLKGDRQQSVPPSPSHTKALLPSQKTISTSNSNSSISRMSTSMSKRSQNPASTTLNDRTRRRSSIDATESCSTSTSTSTRSSSSSRSGQAIARIQNGMKNENVGRQRLVGMVPSIALKCDEIVKGSIRVKESTKRRRTELASFSQQTSPRMGDGGKVYYGA